MSGLNLVRGVERTDSPHVTTEYRAGLSTGAVSRLRHGAAGLERVALESHDEAPMPDEGGRMLRYRIADLEDGVYAAESVGAGGRLQVSYFEITAARIGRVFAGERKAAQELRRLGE